MLKNHRYATFFIALSLTCTLGCASLPIKQQATVTLQASETALEAAHDAERALCNPAADKAQAVTHCEGPQATAVGLTDARHQELARAFSKAFASEAKAATVLIAWKAGDPAPSTLAEYRADLNAILTLTANVIPSTHATVVKVQEAIDDVAKIATIVGVK